MMFPNIILILNDMLESEHKYEIRSITKMNLRLTKRGLVTVI